MAKIPESHRDLLDAQVATLATLDEKGFPQLTEVWFVHDEGTVRISLSSGRYKTRNLQERPQCSLLILDLQNPYRYLELRGRARIEEDDGSLIARVKEKYQADVREFDAPGERIGLPVAGRQRGVRSGKVRTPGVDHLLLRVRVGALSGRAGLALGGGSCSG